jgi:hypothetical protein
MDRKQHGEDCRHSDGLTTELRCTRSNYVATGNCVAKPRPVARSSAQTCRLSIPIAQCRIVSRPLLHQILGVGQFAIVQVHVPLGRTDVGVAQKPAGSDAPRSPRWGVLS